MVPNRYCADAGYTFTPELHLSINNRMVASLRATSHPDNPAVAFVLTQLADNCQHYVNRVLLRT